MTTPDHREIDDKKIGSRDVPESVNKDEPGLVMHLSTYTSVYPPTPERKIENQEDKENSTT